MKKYIIFLFAMTIVFACDDVVETSIVDIEEEIYITGFISPEIDSLKVNVSRLLPALGLEFSLDNPQPDRERFIVRDAVVTIENSNGNTVALPFLEDQLFYAAGTENFKIEPGETYVLNVLANGETYSASCTVPLDNVDTINEQVTVESDEFDYKEYTLDIRFMDIKDEGNFYYVGAFLDVKTEDELLEDNIKPIFFELEAFHTDNLRDGLEIGANTVFYPSLFFDENNQIVIPEQDLVLQVMTTEKPLYDLLRANYLNENNEDNPFRELGVEPNTISGKGASGVFAAYRYFEKRIAFEEE